MIKKGNMSLKESTLLIYTYSHNHKPRIKLDGLLVDKRSYQRFVGKLIYWSHTRLDIAYIVGVMSQFMHARLEDNLEATMRILRYLKATLGIGLLFSKYNHMQVQAYIDVDYAGYFVNTEDLFQNIASLEEELGDLEELKIISNS